MNAKTASKFKRAEDYTAPNPVTQGQPPADVPQVTEVFFRLKLVPASLVQYAVEQITVVDSYVLERKVITERDILPITLSKIEDAIVAQVRR
jgi:hypothetical protein